jgi:hypothetical protein
LASSKPASLPIPSTVDHVVSHRLIALLRRVKLPVGTSIDDCDIFLQDVEAAAYLRISPRTLQRLRQHGIGPPIVRIGRRRLIYRLADLQSWANGQSCGLSETGTRAQRCPNTLGCLTRSTGRGACRRLCTPKSAAGARRSVPVIAVPAVLSLARTSRVARCSLQLGKPTRARSDQGSRARAKRVAFVTHTLRMTSTASSAWSTCCWRSCGELLHADPKKALRRDGEFVMHVVP